MYQSRLKSDEMDRLFEAILSLRDQEECYRFFEDLCTVSELKSLAQRMEVARMLDKGETYQDIVRHTGSSTATISRVNRSLSYGADGYRCVLDHAKEDKA